MGLSDEEMNEIIKAELTVGEINTIAVALFNAKNQLDMINKQLNNPMLQIVQMQIDEAWDFWSEKEGISEYIE